MFHSKIYFIILREEYLKVVAVPVDATMNLLTRIISVTCNSLVSLAIFAIIAVFSVPLHSWPDLLLFCLICRKMP